AAAIGAAFGVLLTQGGGSTASASVGNSLAVIDSSRKSVDSYLPVGSAPSNVTTGEGAVWVLDANDLTISRIDPETRKVTRTFSSGRTPTDLAVGAKAIWVGNGVPTTGSQQLGHVYAASVSRITPANTLVTKLPGRPATAVNEFRIPGIAQLVAGRQGVWAV